MRVFHDHKLPVIHEHRTVLGLFNRYDPLPVVANPRHDILFTSGLARNGMFLHQISTICDDLSWWRVACEAAPRLRRSPVPLPVIYRVLLKTWVSSYSEKFGPLFKEVRSCFRNRLGRCKNLVSFGGVIELRV